MTTKNPNLPTATIRDGAIKATIWSNPGKDGGTRYSIDVSRSYTDAEGNWKDSHHFSPTELLRVARLAGMAYDQIGQLRLAVNEDSTNNGGSD